MHGPPFTASFNWLLFSDYQEELTQSCPTAEEELAQAAR